MTPQETNLMLQQELLEKEEKILEYQDMLYRALKYIEENSTKIGKFTVMISKDQELEYILTEKVEIWI